MTKIKCMIGEQHGRLTVIEFAYLKVRAHWKCKCQCGEYIIVNRQALIRKNTRSCGCLRKQPKAPKVE